MSGWSAEKLQAESRIKRRGRKALLKGPDLHAHNMPCEETFIWRVVAGHLKGGKMKKYNYNFIIHLLLNKYGWTQEEIGAWTWKKTNGS